MKEPKWMLQDDGFNIHRWIGLIITILLFLAYCITQSQWHL